MSPPCISTGVPIKRDLSFTTYSCLFGMLQITAPYMIHDNSPVGEDVSTDCPQEVFLIPHAVYS